MAGLDAGALDRRVRIEAGGMTDDGLGEVAGWATLTTVWARFAPARGAEAREQLGREAQMMATVTVRWSSAVAPIVGADPDAYRLRYPAADSGQVWDIKSAVEIGRHDGIEIAAVARAGEA